MARDVNLTSNEWCDLIFEGKNKKYGAYYLRKTSSRRHFRALILVCIVSVVLIFLPTLIDKVLPQVQEETIQEVVKMAEVDLNQPKVEEQIVQEATPPPPVKEAIKYTPPVIDKNATDEDVMKTQEEVTQSKAVIFSQDIAGSNDADAVDPSTLVVVKEVTQAPPKPVEIVDYAEVMPDFPGGYAALMAFMSKNTTYPIVASEAGIQGRVNLRFAVMEDGSISRIQVIRSVHPSLDAEAVRMIKSMPRWIPGKQNGKAVAVYFQLPVTFTLKNEQ